MLDKDATTKGRDIGPKKEIQIFTNETISLFSNKVSRNQKGIFNIKHLGFITPRDENLKDKMEAWGTPDNTDQTTERVYAMLQMNQNMIQKYQTIKNNPNSLNSMSHL